MNILLLYVPSRKECIEIPYGLLYLASSITEDGHKVKILDLALEDLSDNALISEIESFYPAVIGFGAITSGYRNLKRLSTKIRSEFPAIPLIAGGVIASVSKLLIDHANIDVVVLGEGEITIRNYLSSLEKQGSLIDINGIAYRNDNGKYQENPPEKQITQLDPIPIPPYDLIDLKRYCISVGDYFTHYSFETVLNDSEIQRIKSRGNLIIPILSSRGCVNKCSFCYRHMRGVRQFSPQYVIRQIKYIQMEYGIHFFQFCDELTNISNKWCHQLCDLIDEGNLNITYVINGARASNIDENLLKRLKETGCIKISFGYESGSAKILDYIGKGISKKEYLKVGTLMRKVGLHNTGQIVIGFPPESPATIKETIRFLNELAPNDKSVNYILPFPKTKDWDYCIQKRLIIDEEKFILNYDEASTFKINLTNYSDNTVKRWRIKIVKAFEINELKIRKKYVKLLFYVVSINIFWILSPYLEYNKLPNIIRRLHKWMTERKR